MIDNINDYSDVNLKYARLGQLGPYEKFTFIKGDYSDKCLFLVIFNENKPNVMVNLVAR